MILTRIWIETLIQCVRKIVATINHSDNTTRMTKYKFIDNYGKSPMHEVEEDVIS
jgi:hypothetical protein